MCGRARCTLRPDDVPRACHLSDVAVSHVDVDRYRPSYNVSPGSYLPVVRREDGIDGYGVAVHSMKWGLVPSFSKKDEKPDHYRMFNARSESICEKASFRRLIPKNRCLIAVEGFYEWKKDGSKKQPYYIHFKDGQPLVFAALYDSWRNFEGEILYTFTILTTTSSSALDWLHDRMPVILGDESSTSIWLNGPPSSKLNALLQPYEGPNLVWYPVMPAMGKLTFDGPECIKEIQLKSDREKPISKFFSKRGTTDEIKEHKEVHPSAEEQANAEAAYDGGSGIKIEPDVSAGSPDTSEKSRMKQEYEEFLVAADSKPNIYQLPQPHASPAKKHSFTDRDKQSTLLSYFGKS
ncbi:hypothetical protein Nepgr_004294 [Nepenthes gracilis]|uniref:Embryonic stem cell-specific 5-hydroxymethylcytosine-binding protein n=1 Tax=Nepenthes gracilis TaxID=150966 RepID=A0AAD3S127_NEPGR|nr:hypothetical protein Nepgr_004294 [Nepenthes gracilis]